MKAIILRAIHRFPGDCKGDMTMVCPKCGRRTFKRETVCPKCGAAMPERKPVEIITDDPAAPVEPADIPAQFTTIEGESDLSLFSRKKQKDTEPPAEPTSAAQPTPAPEAAVSPEPSVSEAADEFAARTETPASSEETADGIFTPEPEFKSPDPPEETAASQTASYSEADLSPEFYGSYGEVCNETAASEPTATDEPTEDNTASEVDFSVLDFDIPDVTLPAAEDPSVETASSEETFTYMPDVSAEEDDDELILPDIPMPSPSAENESKKSMGYEDTVKLENAHSAYGNQKPINEPIKAGAPVSSAPKHKDFTAVASGTARVKGDLPKLKEGEMYVAVTPKDLRRLKSRRFRGLGVLATLCLVIISAFCIWSYANSFTDPLIGVWKGDVSSACIPVEQIQQLDQELIASTWEFSSSGSLYLNIVVNETPISLSGSYQQLKDESGEPYLAMTLVNPMDSSEYTLDMYYTVTGDILELNDMEGAGMTIDLTKE